MLNFARKNLALWMGVAGFVLVFLSGACPASATSSAAYHSVLIWRLDGSGDFSLPQEPADHVYVSQPISVSGLVTSMSVSWKGEGDLHLQVSADDGLHYTPVVNGVPLESGFVPGSSFKWKALYGSGAKLTEVKIILKDASGVCGSFGEPQLSGFEFRKRVFIKGSKTMLRDYQVKITVGETDGKDADVSCDRRLLSPDFSDIRFTAGDGETLLAYFLDKVVGQSPDRKAVFFVKVPELPKEGLNVYIYYGKVSAQSLSDAVSTFDFYEPFRDKKAFENTWSLAPNIGGSAVLSPEGLVLKAAGVMTKTYQFSGGVLEYAATARYGFETRVVIRGLHEETEPDGAEVAYASAYGGAQHCLAVGRIVKANVRKPIAQGVPYEYHVSVDEDNHIVFERFKQDSLDKEADVSYQDARGLKAGFVGLSGPGAADVEGATVFHWLRVRKFAVPEPAVSRNLVGEEEKTHLPFFMNTTLAANGKIILKNGAAEGLYILPATTSPFDIRVLSFRLQGSGASVDISSDEGKTYLKDAASDRMFYASRGDFSSSRNILVRIMLKQKEGSQIPCVKSFSLQYAAGSIIVVSPAQGDRVNAGSKMDIRWTARDYDTNYPFRIEYSLDGGQTLGLIADKAKNTGSYAWLVPDRKEFLAEKAMIRISDGYAPAAVSAAAAGFSIVPGKKNEEVDK